MYHFQYSLINIVHILNVSIFVNKPTHRRAIDVPVLVDLLKLIYISSEAMDDEGAIDDEGGLKRERESRKSVLAA